MPTEKNTTFSILDTLTDCGKPFAIYRHPNTGEVHLLIGERTHNTLSIRNLNSESGFVFAPFDTNEDTPIAILKPTLTLVGEDAIRRFSEQQTAFVSQTLPAENEPSEELTSTTRVQYMAMFAQFQVELQRAETEKLVLSRRACVERPTNFSPANTFVKALDFYPQAFVYLTNISNSGLWLGCTPEALLTQENDKCYTTALAGTQKILSEQALETLNWDNKNKREQAIVSEYLRNILTNLAETSSESPTQSIRAGNVAHLKTDFQFRLKPEMGIGNFLEETHPTPAVCGFPKKRAFDFIRQTELHRRSYYAGFVGDLHLNGNTHLYVNLRCMQILPHTLVLYAGGGIMPSSQIDNEWDETFHKMETMRRLI